MTLRTSRRCCPFFTSSERYVLLFGLDLIYFRNSSRFAALRPYKSTNTSLTHNAIISLMVQPMGSDLARFIGSLLPTVINSPHATHSVHRALIAMHTGLLLGYVRRNLGVANKRKSVLADESMLAWILPAAMEPLQLCAQLEVESSKESIIAEVVVSSSCFPSRLLLNGDTS